VMARMRAAQPELNECEFSVNIEEGTWERTGPRDKEEKKEAMPEVKEDDSAMKNVRDMVDALLKKIGARDS